MNKDFNFMLKDFKTSDFPESLCTIKNEREEGVFESEKEFICIVEDLRFNDQVRLMILCPYIYKSKKNVYHGWYSKNWNGTFFSSIYNPIHSEEDEYVIAWRELQ